MSASTSKPPTCTPNAASGQLVQTHDRLCLEDRTVANLMSNRRLARAIGDAAWKACSGYGSIKQRMGLAERIFRCVGCGLVIDRDRTPLPISLPGPNASMSRPRTAKRAAG